jgi:hypothetical protein
MKFRVGQQHLTKRNTHKNKYITLSSNYHISTHQHDERPTAATATATTTTSMLVSVPTIPDIIVVVVVGSYQVSTDEPAAPTGTTR